MKFVVLLLAVFCCSCVEKCAYAAHRQADAQKPNVVLIYIDDLGYGDLGCYGSEDIPTPHIDQLAAEGVRFTASYIANPPCCPSRCSLMMGQYGQKFGKYGMSRGLPIPEDRPTLAKVLSDRGYVTGQIGKWDIGTKAQGPLATGFEEVRRKPSAFVYSEADLSKSSNKNRKLNPKSKYFCLDESGRRVWLTDYDGDSMVNFIERHQDESFFLYWSPEAVHSPNGEVPARLMNRTNAKGQRRKLAGAIVAVDDQVGKLLDVLETHNLRENTLVIFSSDNGANGSEGGSSAPYTGGKGGGTQKEGWVRVPTIFSMPGILPKGKEFTDLVANFDFYSTITANTIGVIPDHCDGVDLFPYLKGQLDAKPHDYLFWLNNEPGDAVRRHLIAARWEDWRLYRKYDKDTWQLFDLKNDPREEIDLAAKYPEVVNQMAARHEAWVKTLAPLAEVPQVITAGETIPAGYGWSKRAE